MLKLFLPLVASALVACVTGPELAPDDPRLEDLGLLYDDTVVTESARTVDFNGQAVVPRSVHIEKSAGKRRLSALVQVMNLVLGISRRFTVRVGVPIVSKNLDRGGTLTSLSASGLGDVALLGKYRFFQRTGRGETTEASLLFGLELPTGRDDARDEGIRLPAPLQPGSGSTDPILGGAFSRVDGRWLLNADLIAKFNTEANDYRFGNVLRADLGCQWRAHPIRYRSFDQFTLNVLAELNAVWAARDHSGGSPVANSGGTKVFFTPGVQFIFNRNVLLEAAVQLPIVMELDGDQLEEDFVSIIGLRARF